MSRSPTTTGECVAARVRGSGGLRGGRRMGVLLSLAAHVVALTLLTWGVHTGAESWRRPAVVVVRAPEEAPRMEAPVAMPVPAPPPQVETTRDFTTSLLPVVDVRETRTERQPDADTVSLETAPDFSGPPLGLARTGRAASVPASAAPAADSTSVGMAAPAFGATRPARKIAGDCAAPAYPRGERRRGTEGIVRLRLHIAADGRVLDVEVEESSGSAGLDRAATDAVRRWSFEPALDDGEAVDTWATTSIRFSLS